MALTMWSRSVKRVELGRSQRGRNGFLDVFGNPWESMGQPPRIHPENRTFGQASLGIGSCWVFHIPRMWWSTVQYFRCSNQGIAGHSRANSGAPRLCWRWEKLLVKRTSRNTSAASRNPAGFGCWRRWLPLHTGECWVLWRHVETRYETSGSKFYDNMITARWSLVFCCATIR